MSDLFSLPASSYRGRLAPSPTGFLHLGHARTFWAAYRRACEAGGTLIMRMEDLDPDRSRDVYAQAALEDLRWLGICWLEGPELGGPYAPYAQSQRRAIYLDAWRKLRRGGYLFPCRCSRKDLETALSAPHESLQFHPSDSRTTAGPSAPLRFAQDDSHKAVEQESLDDEPVYPGTCRSGTCRKLVEWNSPADFPANEIEEPGNFNWRFRVPDGEAVEFVDGNLGRQRYIAGADFGDFVVWRRDGVPSYQLACVADDATMQITEVVRGEDLLKSTARQILLYRALGLKPPAWFHCRLVADKNGRRLAKRHDALSLRTLRQRGVTPEQILADELPASLVPDKGTVL
jgi:glutamyl-tRNA synthetase